MWAGMLENVLMNRLSGSASTLADHAAAYADVIVADVEASGRSAASRLWAAALVSIALAFTLAIACTWLIAATWNTAAHIPVMIGLLLLGVLSTLGALRLLNRQRRMAPRLMSLTLGEWAKDRRMMKELLSANEAAES
jgi:glycerol uptake facilitator-like aquaporin